MNRPEYADLPPAQVWARELDAGNYWCSERTMYRILSAAGQSGERRRQATHPARTIPELTATGPSQVFTWDITKLPGPAKGIWYHAYVIIDIYSRYIVGHTVERAETAERAEELIRETIERNGVVPETVHADRGTSMTSKKVSQLLIDLGITRSHSRPSAFITYYNHDHRHSGIGLHTPASVHYGTAEEVRDQRAVALAEAYERHPERFARRPKPPEIPGQVWINDPAKRRQPEPQDS
ncbi:DDE-type integrase/transposase/recombinase [Streptomyces sp. ME19-03-3]|nr:DDE-type integrase/transposase/recombinase [Streptomyces sp. ME19-03-3]